MPKKIIKIGNSKFEVETDCPVCSRELDVKAWGKEGDEITRITGKCDKDGEQNLIFNKINL